MPGLLKAPNVVLGLHVPAPENAGGPPTEKPKFDRSLWRPIGDTASTAHTTGPAVGGGGVFGAKGAFVQPPPPMPVVAKDDKTPQIRQPRREFVILFLWKEVLPSAPDSAVAKKD